MQTQDSTEQQFRIHMDINLSVCADPLQTKSAVKDAIQDQSFAALDLQKMVEVNPPIRLVNSLPYRRDRHLRLVE